MSGEQSRRAAKRSSSPATPSASSNWTTPPCPHPATVELTTRPFRITTAERQVFAHAIVVATGATAKRLGLPSEHIFWSRGISACAICDGASPIFRGAEVAVVGGGDSAVRAQMRRGGARSANRRCRLRRRCT